MTAHDDAAIRMLLERDVILVADTGGHGGPSPATLRGGAAVASELAGWMRPGMTAARASVNGAPGLALAADDRSVVTVVAAEVRRGRLSRVWAVRDPDRLRHWNR
jgi:hypothetical protein